MFLYNRKTTTEKKNKSSNWYEKYLVDMEEKIKESDSNWVICPCEDLQPKESDDV